MQLKESADPGLEQLYVFHMEQIIRRYRQIATEAFRRNQAGITVDHWVVLKRISEHNGSSQVEIAQSTVKDAPTTTRLIEQLIERKLVLKQLDPDDRRKYRVFVTEKGSKLIERLLPVVMEYRRTGVRDFSPQESETLFKLLRRIRSNLG